MRIGKVEPSGRPVIWTSLKLGPDLTGHPSGSTFPILTMTPWKILFIFVGGVILSEKLLNLRLLLLFPSTEWSFHSIAVSESVSASSRAVSAPRFCRLSSSNRQAIANCDVTPSFSLNHLPSALYTPVHRNSALMLLCICPLLICYTVYADCQTSQL